jgi:hypothetical protein
VLDQGRLIDVFVVLMGVEGLFDAFADHQLVGGLVKVLVDRLDPHHLARPVHTLEGLVSLCPGLRLHLS